MESKRKLKMGSKCCVCKMTFDERTNARHRFYAFPRDKILSDKWSKFVANDVIKNCDAATRHRRFSVCSHHFEDAMFSHKIRGTGLVRNAIPTLHLDDAPPAKKLKVESSTMKEFTGTNSSRLGSTTSAQVSLVTSSGDENAENSTEKQYTTSIIESADFEAGRSSSPQDVEIVQPLSDFDSFNGVEYIVDDNDQSDVEDLLLKNIIPRSIMEEYKHSRVGSPEELGSRRSCGVQTTSVSQLRKTKKTNRQPEHQQSVEVQAGTSQEPIPLEQFFRFLEFHVPGNTSKFMKTHYAALTIDPKSRSLTKRKLLALTMYFLGGSEIYSLVSKIFNFPSKSSLSKLTSPWNLPPGLHDFVFDLLRAKVNTMKEKPRDCILCVGEMAVKSHLYYRYSRDEIIGFGDTGYSKTFEPATKALVIMARGIHCNWTQPLAYFFVNESCQVDELVKILREAIDRVQRTGLNVHALISHLRSNFYSLSQKLGVTPDRPFFCINDKNIFYMFGTPSLLKSTRNHFFENNLHTAFGVTDKKYLEQFYEHIQKLTSKGSFPLTEAHMHPDKSQKMSLKYASQVFSRRVVHGMSLYTFAVSAITTDASPTVSFIEAMDQLFDLFNSSPKNQTEDKWATKPFTDSDEQTQFLAKMEHMFRTMTVVSKKNKKDVTSSTRFIKGWLINIGALRGLWDALKDKKLPLFTRRFSRECLDIFFGQMKETEKFGNVFVLPTRQRIPSPFRFMCNFKRLFRQQFLTSDYPKSRDLEQLMRDTTDTTVVDNFEVALQKRTPFTPLTTETLDHSQLTQSPALYHICRYLMEKCLTQHSCDTCMAYAAALDSTEDGPFGNLVTSAVYFYEYIKSLDNMFMQKFKELALLQRVGLRLKRHLDQIELQPPCPSFPVEYLVTLFVRVRIFHLLRNVNVSLGTKKDGGRNGRRKMIVLRHL